MSDPSSLLGLHARRDAPAQRRAVDVAGRAEVVAPLLTTLTAIAGAATVVDVAQVAVAAAVDIAGARAGALGRQRGDTVVLDASVGYDCDSMAAGATLPLDAGLPITECVRTGRTVVRGQPGGPSWVAVPVATADDRGALLVSLTPAATPDPAPLEVVAGAVAATLERIRAVPTAAAPWLHTDTALVAPPSWLAAAALTKPQLGSGDVVGCLPGAADDLCWVLVGDARGSGTDAAATADRFRNAAVVLAGSDSTPRALLAAADRALRRTPAADRHVTALAARLTRRPDGRIDVAVASAGHPSMLRWHDGDVTALRVEPGLPLNLLDPASTSYDVELHLTIEPGDLLLAYTDGLVEHGPDDRTDMLLDMFGRAGALRDPVAVADVVHAAMTADVDAIRDDVALLVVGVSP